VADSVTRAQHRDTESNRQRFFSLIGRHLSGLYHVVRHELAYREAVGDLLPGEVAVEDVVDAVLLSAYREFVKEPPARRLGGWLIERARKYLAAEVKRSRSERKRTVHIEEDVPETPPQQFVSTLGDEILDFHEPDEDLRLEDIVPDLTVPTPEQETVAAELRQCVDEALAGLPSTWRRAVLLRHINGLAGAALAGALGRPEAETDRMLDHARAYLRQRLVESGCAFQGADRR
jgi:RNA polymerase sigma factor (sigma-70 family)